MQSLPPIRNAGANANANTKSRSERATTPDVPSLAATLNARGTTASAADGINRNQLRQEAGRRVQHITHGVAEQQTYLNMLQHIREQFAHTSQQPLQPLVLPPQWPSTARPREPQTAKFSRGIAMHKSLQKQSEGTTLEGSAETAEEKSAAAALSKTREPSVQGAAGALVIPPAAADTAAASVASYVPTELPSTSTHFARAHRWEAMNTDDRTFFQRRWRDDASSDAGAWSTADASGNAFMQPELDLSPLEELPTLAEKIAYLSDLESASRQHVMAYERWDQQVISEMMAVRYVTFVLKPCMDALRMEETEEREKIYQHEDRVSFYLLHESALVMAIAEERKAMKARELQLDRILGVTPPSPPPPPQTSAQTQPQQRRQPSGIPNETEAPFEEGALGRSRSSYAAFRAPNPPSLPPPIPTTGNYTTGTDNNNNTSNISNMSVSNTNNYNNNSSSNVRSTMTMKSGTTAAAAAGPTYTSCSNKGGVSAPEARRMLQQYVRQRHGSAIDAAAAAAASPMSPSAMPKTWSPTTNATYPGAGGRDAIRRSSALMLPPLPSAHGPRRNAVGIADYVALLDECMQLRDHLIRAEQQSRDDLNRACYEEQQVVLEWQRRRMHLERLMYWRHQREEAVQEELSALTEVNVGAPLDAKVALLLELLEGEEEDARAAVAAAEAHCRETELWATGATLRHDYDAQQLEDACWSTFVRDVQGAEAAGRQDLLVKEEAGTRHCVEKERLHALREELQHGMAQLRVLWEVSISPAHGAALRVLQSAFSRSLRGKLGWRATHNAVGREISDARNTRKIKAGKRTLQSFKDALAAEEAALRQEQEAQNIREQHVLFAGESADRVAVVSEQDLMRQGLRRAKVLHVAEVYQPIFARLRQAEHDARVQLEVEEDVDDEALRTSHAAVTDIIAQKARTRYDETAARKALVAEERGVWRELRGAEGDTREELRLDAETKEAMRQANRTAFAAAALEASRRYREGAFHAYVRQMTEVELEMLGYSSADSAERWAICAEESKAATQLFAELSLQTCEVYAKTLWETRQAEMCRTHRQALCAGETERRADLLLSESIEWEALQPMLLDALSGPLRDLIVRRGAVNAISTWYRAVRNGDVGRAVSRQQLREDLARYHEERHLREQQIAQRLHTQQVRDQLDVLMREIQQEEVAAVQQRMDILVHREEPRGREEVASMQEIVFGIIVRNAEAHTAEVRRQLVNTEALLWQQESYERKLLIKASRRAFTELMERERLQLSEDYFAARIQRTWAAYAARKQHAQAMADQRARLVALEQQARVAIELEELETVSMHLYKPANIVIFYYAHLRQALSDVYKQLCVTGLAAISAREWQERAALLWEMRYDLCDSCLCSEEEKARRALAAEFHKPFLLQAELVRTEGEKRQALQEERTGFLLRILAREELAQRQAIVKEETGALSELKEVGGGTPPVGPSEL